MLFRSHDAAGFRRGSEDRINLVIDCVANDWLRAKIDAADPLRRTTGGAVTG